METTQKDLLLHVRTTLENKGAYRLCIRNSLDLAVMFEHKVRQKDDVTHVISNLTPNEYFLVLVRNGTDVNKIKYTLKNYEPGSELYLEINDGSITVNDSKLQDYKSLDELVDIISKVGNQPKEKRERTKRKKNSKGKESSIQETSAQPDTKAEANDTISKPEELKAKPIAENTKVESVDSSSEAPADLLQELSKVVNNREITPDVKIASLYSYIVQLYSRLKEVETELRETKGNK